MYFSSAMFSSANMASQEKKRRKVLEIQRSKTKVMLGLESYERWCKIKKDLDLHHHYQVAKVLLDW